MAGVKALRKIQLGRESTAGTAVAATTIWRGMGTIKDDQTKVFVNEDIGIIAGGTRMYTAQELARIEFEPVEATFEQLPHILEAGVMTATPTTDGSGSDRVYTYNFPTTAQPTLKAYTIEGGDDQGQEEMEYSLVDNITLAGTVGEAWMMSANWVGRQVSTSTFTTSATLPTVKEMMFNKTSLYIHTGISGIESYQKTSTLLEAEFEYSTGVTPIFAADGNLYFASHKIVAPEATLRMVYEHNATSIAEKVFYGSDTLRAFRLRCAGATLGTAGTTYSTKTMIIDLMGYYADWSKIGERNGNDIVEVEVHGVYSSSDSLYGRIIVVNELTSLP